MFFWLWGSFFAPDFWVNSYQILHFVNRRSRIVQKILGKASDDSLLLKDFFGPQILSCCVENLIFPMLRLEIDFRGPQMGGQIRRGRIWRFWGAPIFSPEVPKYLFFKGFRQRFRKGVGGKRGSAPGNPSHTIDSGLFSAPFLLSPL